MTTKRCPEKQTSIKWLAKTQSKDHTQNEMLTGEAFRIMLGADVAPKYRFMNNHENTVVTLSRLPPNFIHSFSHKSFFETIFNTIFPKSLEKLTEKRTLESVKICIIHPV